jgi:Uma2 family endonuclease
MKWSPDSNGRKPDILFVANEHLDRLTTQKLAGAADLVVEVISPESVYRDHSDKYDEYAEAGVCEYWLVDSRPGRHNASFWVLDAAGRYQPAPVDQNGIYRSTVIPGFWLKVNWLWANEKLSPLLLFAEIAGLPVNIVEAFKSISLLP